MAKEQKRGNKEARKSKGEKKKPVVTATVSALMAAGGATDKSPRKKS